VRSAAGARHREAARRGRGDPSAAPRPLVWPLVWSPGRSTLDHGRTTVSSWTERGVSADPPQAFFLERYAESYRAELEHFIDAVLTGSELLEGPEDGIRALVLAEAAMESLRTGRSVEVQQGPAG